MPFFVNWFIKQNNLKGETFQICFVWATDKASPFSFGAFWWVDTIWGKNGATRFDISAAERGLRSNFWDHSEIFQLTGFGVINPKGQFLEKIASYTIYGQNFIFLTMLSFQNQKKYQHLVFGIWKKKSS